MRRLVLFAMMLALAPSMLAQTGKVEQQVLQAEKDRFAAMVKGDRPALEKLLADDLTYTHSTALLRNQRAVHQERDERQHRLRLDRAERIGLESPRQRQHCRSSTAWRR